MYIGWGDLKLASELPGIIAAMPQETFDSATIDLHLQDTISYDGVSIQQGSFESPLSSVLPTESKQAHFEVVLPHLEKGDSPPPMVVVLPSTGEHGFSRQRTCLSIPLAKNHSIGSIILEGPFYGQRRPGSQRGSKLRTVADLINLSRATISESRVLLDWLQRGDFGPLALCGASMGGLHAMMTASVVPIPVGSVSWIGPPGPGPVFTHGLMSSSVNWENLSNADDLSVLLQTLPAHSLPGGLDMELATHQAAHGSSTEREALARILLSSYFSLSTILHFQPPMRPDACMFTVAESDMYMDR
jgi:pimeloyl-ACP methyl ester carboxylesterase